MTRISPSGHVASLGHYWERLRQMLPTTFAYCSLVAVGALFEATNATGRPPPLFEVAVAAAALALVVCGQWFVNDVFDMETDRHSNTERPTTTGDIATSEALWVGSIAVVVGLGMAVPLGAYALGSLVAFAVVNTAYTVPPLRTKDGGLSSMVTLGTMGGCSVLLGSGTVAARPTALAVKIAAIAAGFMAINLSYKDLKDAEHDRRSGVENFAVRYGPDAVRRVLMVVLPVSYVVVTLYFGLYRPLPVVVGFGAYVWYQLSTWDGGNEIVYRLDAVNGLFVVGLGVAYYVFQ